MAYDYVNAAHFDRAGTLVQHGDADRLGRCDAIEFQGRTNQVLIDWLGEVTVWLDRWPTRNGIAVLLEQQGPTTDASEGWTPIGHAIPFDGIYLRYEQEVKLAFSSYLPFTPGARYRLQCPGAVMTRPTLRLGVLQRRPDTDQGRRERHREAAAAVRKSA